MSTRYNNIGQVVVTMPVTGTVAVGSLVKMQGSSAVLANPGDDFIGVVLDKRGDYVSVQVRGFVTVRCLETIPTGYQKLVVNTASSVRVPVTDGDSPDTNGKEHLVLSNSSTSIDILL